MEAGWPKTGSLEEIAHFSKHLICRFWKFSLKRTQMRLPPPASTRDLREPMCFSWLCRIQGGLYSSLSSSMKPFHRWFSIISEALKAMQKPPSRPEPQPSIGWLVDDCLTECLGRRLIETHHCSIISICFSFLVFVHVVFRILTCLSVRLPQRIPRVALCDTFYQLMSQRCSPPVSF